eukprot:jgi/Botrbrau1/4447/Bobra.0348s0035.1
MGLKAARCLRSFLPNLHAQGKQVACFASNHDGRKWEVLRSEGHDLNPCNSRLHPSVVEGGIEPRESTEIPVQEAYTPDSRCFGCGPSAQEGLKLRSFRIPGGLEATISLDPKYLAFPGIINGGVISTLFDCHGNWTAAIALMDKAYLPRPPLTLTYEMLVNFKEPTPAEQKLIVRSQVVRIKESSNVTLGKAAVQVELSLHLVNPFGREKLLVSGLGVFKKMGALRAL